MLGYDVTYSNDLADALLLTTAENEKRILLTRDSELCKNATVRGIDALCLEGKSGVEKLAELNRIYQIKLEIDMQESRCPKCNTTVRPISRQKAAKEVERNTFEHYKEFWECPICSQIYWQGAHWTRIRKTLNAAKKGSQKKK
jgi:uncharacterized protein with PIN domain